MDRGGAQDLEGFDRHRTLLLSIAYRMLGSVMEAEDVVQEAYLRWRTHAEEVRSERAYLSAVVTRLCIDKLRSARREEYVGPWLPEPLPEGQVPDPSESVALEESLSMAFLGLLESLTPVERAVFLLREVFGYDYVEISRIVGKSEANCRQISRPPVRRGLAATVQSPAGGGGAPDPRVPKGLLRGRHGRPAHAARRRRHPLVRRWRGGTRGAETDLRRGQRRPVHRWRTPQGAPDLSVVPARVNGDPGLIGYFGDGSPHSATTFEFAGGRIKAIRLVVNPGKLGGIPPLGTVGR